MIHGTFVPPGKANLLPLLCFIMIRILKKTPPCQLPPQFQLPLRPKMYKVCPLIHDNGIVRYGNYRPGFLALALSHISEPNSLFTAEGLRHRVRAIIFPVIIPQ